MSYYIGCLLDVVYHPFTHFVFSDQVPEGEHEAFTHVRDHFLGPCELHTPDKAMCIGDQWVSGLLGSVPLQLRTSRLANARPLSPSRTNGHDTLLVPPRDLRSCKKARWMALWIGRRLSTSPVITVVCAWRAYRYVSSSFCLRHPFIELPSRLWPLLV